MASIADHDQNDTHALSKTFQDQFARFKIWAGNIGAHRTGRSSLDYRLRDASHLRGQTIRLLENLTKLIEEASSICLGKEATWDQEAQDPFDLQFSDSDDEFPLQSDRRTELSQISDNVADMLDCLFRLAVSTRNPAPHDRFKRANRVDLSHFEQFDIAHVREVLARAPTVLAERLGKAITRRREYLEYRKAHHQRLARGLEDGQAADDTVSTVASSIPQNLRTPTVELAKLPVIDEDRASDGEGTETTVGSSLVSGERSRIPPLPTDAYDRPFVCPFCGDMISATTTRAWTKHVLADLHPYICLAPDCQTPSDRYKGRREWMRHVLSDHWKLWNCAFGCKSHIMAAHPNAPDLASSVDGSEISKPRDATSQCPLCQEQVISIKGYVRHVGRHQKELALFALPRLDEHDDNDNPNAQQAENREIQMTSMR
ncbi:hypothetical protein QBC34DRAFT_455118 [Podospora aff. communis PSN243]|uniref:C2H2-type domain-containing protein n=1 Tax=Podospora aff. communis PSN243 TaxID=3040156 RepID=A0AAV9G124_9PEZI|nr:hypothetical protein QBC34DRAFT_455118 [Podospora aff. communis PSN243]